VKNARKAAGLAVEDRIRLVLGGDDELVGAAQAHEDYLVREVLAVEISYDGALEGEAATIEDRELRIGVARA
jgi:isoleucyl-tRNA synthetase